MKRIVNYLSSIIKTHRGQIRRKFRTALVLVLCFSIAYTATGCNNILGDGEITIVTAPPLVTPKVVVTDSYGEGDPDRFAITGTDAFYLLPGIENNPDFFQDFICLDYTKEGYFIYYYCAPAYISDKEIEKLKFSDSDINSRKTKIRPDEPYEAIDRSKKSEFDAMILMAYKPSTKEYLVLDAQAYNKNTANSESGGEANTGVEFYKSPNYEFYMLSHCYGTRIASTGTYLIVDQKGHAKTYNSKLKLTGDIDIGGILDYKVKELETDIKAKAKSGQNVSDLVSDFGDDSDESKKEKDEAMSDLQNATGHTYNAGGGSVANMKLNYLIKSVVTDSTGLMYASLMIYTGESPWSADALFNRVVCLTKFDLNSEYGKFISVNKNYQTQIDYYKANYEKINFYELKRGKEYNNCYNPYTGETVSLSVGDNFTPFFSEKRGEGLFVTGFANGYYWGFYPFIGFRFWRDYLYGLMSHILNILERYLQSMSASERLVTLQTFYRNNNLLPYVGGFDSGERKNTSNLPDKKENWYYQNLFFTSINMDDETYGKSAYKAPRLYPILNKHSNDELDLNVVTYYRVEDPVYYVPYEYNEEILITRPVQKWVPDAAKASKIVDKLVEYIISKTGTDEQTIRDFLAAFNGGNVINAEGQVIYFDLYDYLGSSYAPYNQDPESMPMSFSTIKTTIATGYSKNDFKNALSGYVSTIVNEKDENYTIPAGTFPKSYRLVFPTGSYIESADMDNTEGSSTTSVDKGALLFYDDAKNKDGNMIYTSGIRLEMEAGIVFSDKDVPGAAIDTGSLRYDFGNGATANILMLITEEGVKFYIPTIDSKKVFGKTKITSISWKEDDDSSCYIENEKLLSSTGFTPYTESGTQAAVTNRVDNEMKGDEKYKDNISTTTTQKDITLSLNSSRVGTLQSSSSFTAVNNNQLLITAYDSGLSLMNFKVVNKVIDVKKNNKVTKKNVNQLDFEVINLRSGSYYQSFLDNETKDYKIIGFDTEDFLYGAMDLARAKVYDFSFNKAKNEILEKAMKNELDQKAIDYVRRLHRTRVDIEEDSEGKITKQTTVLVDFDEDHSEEAEEERLLFERDEATAKNKLHSMAIAKGLSKSDSSWEYLKTLREKVTNQQKALNEIFILTKADKLGDISKDPYWEGLKERLQYTTEMGDLKDILAEIVTEDKMLQKFAPKDIKTYQDFRKTLNYKQEQKDRNKVLEDVGLSAEDLTKMIDENKSAEDYKEDYESAKRGQDEETDAFADALNTDGIMGDGSQADEPDRMKIRALIIEDIENAYFEAHPLEPEKVYAPDGTYTEMVTTESEDEVWEAYLEDLLSRINPDNLSAQRESAIREFAELTYTTARVYENGKITDKKLTVTDDTKKKMVNAIKNKIKECETIGDVEALFFGTQVQNLGNPYGGYRDAFVTWQNKEYKSISEKSKAMRSADWYIKLKSYLLSDTDFATFLEARNQSWEEYIQSIFNNQTGNILKDDQTGQAAGAYTSAASTLAQLVEFMCEGESNVSKETKIAMVEDLLIGLENISGAESVEEAVMIERMTLPAYKKYMSAYEEFNKREFGTTENADNNKGTKPVAVEMSSEASIRRKELVEQEFYKKVIGTMKDSELVKSYLEDNKQDWEHYMASLATLAADSEIEDPAASARSIYENFEPYKPIDKSTIPETSKGDEERPVAYGD